MIEAQKEWLKKRRNELIKKYNRDTNNRDIREELKKVNNIIRRN